MEFIIAVIVLVAFDILAMRFGADSRALVEDTRRSLQAIRAQT